MTQSALSRVEQGQPLTIDQLWIFAAAFDLKPHQLVQHIMKAQEALAAAGVPVKVVHASTDNSLVGGLALGALLTVLVNALRDDG